MRHLITKNEEARLNALRNLGLLDTPPSESYDRITRMASRLLGAPVSTISLTDHDRQWFKSRVGVDLAEIPRHEAPCHYAIESDQVFIVPDMLEDERFANSLLARAGIRFYAGAPLITRSGYGLGTLCVIDNKPRHLSDEEQQLLLDLTGMVMTQIEVQNSIGRVDPVSGHANEYQLLEDLEDLTVRRPNVSCVGLLVELVAAHQVSQGMRVLGASYVEELVRCATEAIHRAARGTARLYHVGPARCVLLLEDTATRYWKHIARNIDANLREPIKCGDIPVRPDPVLGMVEFDTSRVTPRDVLRRLYNAADDARHAGGGIATYNERRDQAHARSFRLLSDIRDALQASDQFFLVYQPRIDFATGKFLCAEALLRWRHPQFHVVSPGEFIPLVEETAFTRPLTRWVLNNALQQIAAWKAKGLAPKVSINISPLNLEEEDFASSLGALLARYDVDVDEIELEFTESTLAKNSARLNEQINQLCRMKVSIAIDDFGTGYNSFAHLQQIPTNVLKIDQSFVRPIPSSKQVRKLVRAMITMAHDLGYRVVAEGIETREAYDILAAWQCNEAQGYYLAPPLSPAELDLWLPKKHA